MSILIESWKVFAVLCAAMFVMLELGRLFGRRRLRADPQWDGRGTGALESTVLALLGLLLAFAFSGAWSRYDARRQLILQETNAIGTAWLRLDLVPEPARAPLQASFRRYVDLRLESTRASETRPGEALVAVQRSIWTAAVAATQGAADGRLGQLLLPAVNEMFDLASTRYVAVQTHPPAIVFVMLQVIMLFAALLAGYGMAAGRSRHWLHIGCFVGSLVLAVYVTIDLEYPRRGFVRVDSYDQLLVDLRAGMK